MTFLIAAVQARYPADLVARARQALDAGADLVELRLDTLADPLGDLVPHLAGMPAGRWLATCRSAGEGGGTSADAATRLAVLRIAAGYGPAYVDVETALLEESALPPATAPAPHGNPAALILSTHFWQGLPAGYGHDWYGWKRRFPRAIIKLAWNAADINESLLALDMMHAAPGERMVMCMGEKGLLSRVLAAKAQGFGTFCAPTAESATAPGQPTLRDMIDLYRFPGQTKATRVYGVIGSPVAHSLSPLLFNRLFAAAGLDAVYLPLRIDTRAELFAFLDGLRARDWLGFHGLSVTVPHKAAVLAWAEHGADATACRLGAANTLTLGDEPPRAGNTDYVGVRRALGEAFPGEGRVLSGLEAAVLGAGGAARAVVAAIQDLGGRVTICNRSAERAAELAGDFECAAADWEQRPGSAALLVNCTPLGMWPNVADSPLPAAALDPRMTVFDTVYNPLETRLLREARAAGCRTISGVRMFVHQAAAQYHHWTGREPDRDMMTLIVTGALTRGSLAQESLPFRREVPP